MTRRWAYTCAPLVSPAISFTHGAAKKHDDSAERARPSPLLTFPTPRSPRLACRDPGVRPFIPDFSIYTLCITFSRARRGPVDPSSPARNCPARPSRFDRQTRKRLISRPLYPTANAAGLIEIGKTFECAAQVRVEPRLLEFRWGSRL